LRYVAQQLPFEPKAKCPVLPEHGLVGPVTLEALGRLDARFILLANLVEWLAPLE
jgi:hypothetical protein